MLLLYHYLAAIDAGRSTYYFFVYFHSFAVNMYGDVKCLFRSNMKAVQCGSIVVLCSLEIDIS